MHVTMAYLRLMKQVGRIWLFNLNHYICERWKQKFDNHGIYITLHHWLSTFEAH
jgi:hypothetical protein